MPIYSEVFSYEHTPRMPVADAVRISMSIPLFFSTVRCVRDNVYVDRGVYSRPPMHKIDNFFDYTWGLIETIMEAQTNQHLHSDDWQILSYEN